MYRIDNLGSTPNFTVEPADIGADGRIVGTLIGAPGVDDQAFLWDPWNGIQTLPSLGRPAEARAINAAGVIAGATTRPLRAVRWDNKTPTELPSAPGAVASFVHAINESVVVGGGHHQVGPISIADIWWPAAGPQPLPLPVDSWNEVLGLNNRADLQAVGSSQFLWSASSGAVALQGNPVAINDQGEIVGTDRTGTLPVRWVGLSLETLELLTSFAGGEADDVNNHGEIVGHCTDPGRVVNRACIWNRLERCLTLPIRGTALGIPIPIVNTRRSRLPQVEELNSLIDGSLGWDLQTAVAVNNSGQITGVGTLQGNPAAYRLTPPSSPPDLGWALVAAVISILVGGRLGDPGIGLGPQGPVPIPPHGPERDLVLSSLIVGIANQLENPASRDSLRRVALQVVLRGAEGLMRDMKE